MSIQSTCSQQVHTHSCTSKILWLYHYHLPGVYPIPTMFNLSGLVYLGNVPAFPLPAVDQVHHVQVRTARGAPRWLPLCNIPNATTHTTYLAVLPPVLNIIPVSWTLEVCSRWDLEWFSDSLDIGHDKCLCNVHGTGHNEVTSSNCQVKLSWLPHWKTFAMETKESTESKAFYCQYYFQQGLAVLQT